MSTRPRGKLPSLPNEAAQGFGGSELNRTEARRETNDRRAANPDSRQQEIRAKCIQSAAFVEFLRDDIEQSISERFEDIVRKHPHTIAVKVGQHAVTYAELNAMSNRIAHALVQQRGLEAEPIGVLLKKGLEQIVVVLGILKAGKFFALLDPSFPRAHNTVILTNLQPGIVITNQDTVSSSTGTVEQNHYCFWEIESCDANTRITDLDLRIPPREHAVILYTSGSTGEPKGVIQSHRNVLHNIMLRTNTFAVAAGDKLSVLASGTPNAVMNAFLGLLNGATLVLFDVQKEGTTHLADWFLRERISFCWSTAPLFRRFCDTLRRKEEFPDLRHVVLASDKATKTDFDLFKKHFSVNTALSNALTGSETGLLRTFTMDHNTEIPGDDLPVGYVVEDKEILLLDDEGKQVDFNEAGEIVVSSEYISPGYWRRSDLTDVKFKPNSSGRQLYFTGDLGFMLPDGCLVYKGRKDFRVKIRGYGVEIAEVEKTLRQHPMIKETVIVASRDESGEARLVAYFVGSPQGAPRSADLREFLNKNLPDYMIPSVFVKLDSMPLSAGGKVDRTALPDPEKFKPEPATPFVAPRTSVEKELAMIWTEVLSLDRVGIDDHFVDLGGHSLAAMQIVSRVLQRFQLEMSVRLLFEFPTVTAMAAAITEYQVKKHNKPEIERTLDQVESISEFEAQQLLTGRTRINSTGKRDG